MKTALIALVALPLVAGVAFASPQQDSMQPDSMHSGMMHKNGMMHMPSFNKLDENRDGYVSRDEMKMGHHSMMMDHWQKMDADGDGKISRSEYRAFEQQHMDNDMGHGDGM